MCQQKHLNMPDSTVPITLGSLAPLVVKTGTKNELAVFFRFLQLDTNISITICLIGLCKVPKDESWQAKFNGTHNIEIRPSKTACMHALWLFLCMFSQKNLCHKKDFYSNSHQNNKKNVSEGHYWEPKELLKPSAGARKKGIQHPEFLVSLFFI